MSNGKIHSHIATFDITKTYVCTCVRGSLLEADITHSDRAKTPASLRDGRSLRRAAITEALPTGTAVMFGIVVLEHCVTLMAYLVRKKKNKQTCD